MAEKGKPARGKQDWRTGQPAAGPRPRAANRRRQTFWLLLVLLAVGGVTLAWVLRFRLIREPFFLPLCITEYRDPHLPPNAQAGQDLHAFLDGAYFRQHTTHASTSQESGQIAEELRALRDRKANEAVVLYLSAFVLGDRDGQLYLLPGDADIDRRSTWLKFQDVLDTLGQCKSQRKFLILDVMRPLADPRLGVLANDAARRVQRALERVSDPSLLVLCACAPGQVAWPSQALGQSVFGYFVDRGLRGAADGDVPSEKPDGVIRARELYHYVRTRVDAWARHSRAARQTPVLYGAADLDFALSPTPRQQPADEAGESGPLEYPAWLTKAWELRDRCWEDESYRLAPEAFRRWEVAVLRSEQRWRGGADPARVESDLGHDRGEFETRLGAVRERVQPLPPFSLAGAAAGRKSDPKDAEIRKQITEELKALLRKLDSVRPENRQADAKAAAKPPEEFVKKTAGLDPDALAVCVVDAGADGPPPRPEHVRFLWGVLSGKSPDLPPERTEALFMRRLNDLAGNERAVKGWRSDAVQEAIRAERSGARAAACDPRVLSWVRDELTTADQKRHEGEVLLFSPGFAAPGQAADRLREAVNDLQNVNRHIDALDEGYRLRDEALCLLPSLAPALMNVADAERPESDWRQAISAVTELDRLLAGTAPPRIEQVTQLTESLKKSLGRIRPNADSVAGLLKRAKNGDPQAPTDIDRLLLAGCLKSEQRKALWAAAVEPEVVPGEEAAKSQRDARQEVGLSDSDTARAERDEQQRAVWRARLAIDLLQLSGGSEAESLRGALAKTERADTTDSAWAALGNDLRQALADLPERLKDPKTGLPYKDRLSRLVNPLDLSAANADDAAAQQLQLERLKNKRQWLAAAYRYEWQDAKNLSAQTDGEVVRFFREAANRLSDDAGGAAVEFAVERAPVLKGATRSECQLRLTVSPPLSAADVRVEAVTADDWLRVTPRPPELESSGRVRCSFDVQLAPESDRSSAPEPLGFLAAVRVGTRTYHHQVPAELPPSASGRPILLVSTTSNPPSASSGDFPLGLRSLAPQPVYVFVRNPGEQPRTLTVRAGGKVQSNSERLAKGETKTAHFPEQAVPANKPLTLTGTPPRLELELLDEKGIVVDHKRVSIAVESPERYLSVTRPPTYHPQDKRLTVRVQANEDFPEAYPCRVELVVNAGEGGAVVPGRKGRPRAQLTRAGQEVELTVEPIEIRDDRDEDENGFASLTVDGVPRAFAYRGTFARRGSPVTFNPEPGKRVRLVLGRSARSDRKLTFPVEVNDRRGGVSLHVLVDNVELKSFSSARDQAVTFFTGGPDGTLLVAGSVKDWEVEYDPREGVGPCEIRAELRGHTGQRLDGDTQTVTFDATPPEPVQITAVNGKDVEPNRRVVRVPPAETLVVRARGADPESDVKDVHFYLGKPAADKTPPKDVALEKGRPLRDGTWEAELRLPSGAKGDVEVTAQFTNNVEMSSNATATVVVVAPVPKEKPTTGSIRGRVLQDNRPQPQWSVSLVSVKDANDAHQTTSAEGPQDDPETGTFLFKDIKPGQYKLTATRSGRSETGQLVVTVTAGVQTPAEIKVVR